MSFKGLRFWRRDSFKIEKTPLTPEQEVILDKIAKKVVYWRMTTPAILFLESVKPMNYLGSQMLVFFEPFVQALFNVKEYNEFIKIMEERENVERLLLKIEKFDGEMVVKEKEEKKKRKEEKKLRKLRDS
jgi:hypothetical protein